MNNSTLIQLKPNSDKRIILFLPEVEPVYISILFPIQPNSTSVSLIHSSSIALEKNSILDTLSEENEEFDSASLALFFKNVNLIRIPTKVNRTLRKFTNKTLLREIHEDEDTAIELCLIFLSKLASTYFIMKDNPDDPVKGKGWKPLHTDILIREFSLEINTYKKIVNALCNSTSEGPIIECDRKKVIGQKCFYYRYGDSYRAKGIENYELKTEVGRKLLNKSYFNRMSALSDNIITRNLIKLYADIELPSLLEIEEEARRLVSIRFKTKKGKKLTFLNKHPKEYFKYYRSRSFVEDSIEIFDYLTSNGLMIPQVGLERSGGRIVDSFTLMPSWIRNLCKINGKRISDVDYVCFHPNIALSEYGGNKTFLTHQDITVDTGIGEDDVKVEHLSFFNKKWNQMMQSPLFEYYSSTEPEMMSNIYFEKEESQYGHKATSMRLFRIEVKIMTEAISKLNARGIYVGYVYDALFCQPEERELVKQIMDEVALIHGVKTTAKYEKTKGLHQEDPFYC